MIKHTLVLGTSIAALMLASGADARVTKIVVESKQSPAYNGQAFGAAGAYEILRGKAYGELDPKDKHNSIIQDIALAPKNARGMVEYTASFQIVKPVDMSKASHLMWHDVPNRGGEIAIVPDERNLGDVGLASGWQGESAGQTVPNAKNEYVIVPVAHNPDGSPITGPVLGRIFNASGANSQPLLVYSNPVPYKPASLDTSKATLTSHVSESLDGKITGEKTIAATDWAWAKCDAGHPFPGTPDPTQICLKSGFDASLLYQIVFTAKDPYVLGIGFAAFRDVGSFFRYAAKDDAGTANPVAGNVKWTISRGVSQSGNFLRQFLHLGFNQDESNKQLYDGAWPIIAGRRIAMNVRFGEPDGVLMMYQLGSEGPQWWSDYPDTVRGLPALGILDRCNATHTCPKIIEHFGGAEVWGLKLTPEWVGTSGDKDIPLPANVRRYYIGSSQHGGGRGGFSTTPLDAPMCPGTEWGKAQFAGNPMPQGETVNALRVHFRDWVMKNVAPPPSVYPKLADGTLVDDTKEAMGFPAIPGIPGNAPTAWVNPVLDYDLGPDFHPADGSGVISKVPPAIKHVITMKVPKVDADGNELGMVPVVLRGAPLGTYLGWNVTAAGYYKGTPCNYAGGMIPFAKTRAERTASNDPRPSLEERYRDHAGYVAAVQKSADAAVKQGFLLDADAKKLVDQAQASNVLN